MDAEDTQIIAVQPHIDQGEDVREEAKEGFYAASRCFQACIKPCWPECLFARVRLPLRQFSQDSQLHPEVGVLGGWGHRQMYVITDGGVLRVDLLMVQEPARSSLLSFPSSLHHHEEKTNGVWMAFLRFDNAQTMRMLSRRLTEH